jgi:hypothetical protein
MVRARREEIDMSASSIDQDRRGVDRREVNSTADPSLDGDRRGLDRRLSDRLRTKMIRREWLEALVDREIAGAL